MLDIESLALTLALFATLWIIYGKPVQKAAEAVVCKMPEIPIEENVIFFERPSQYQWAVYQDLLTGGRVIREGESNQEQSADQKELESVFGEKDYSSQKVGFDCNYVAQPVRARPVAVAAMNDFAIEEKSFG